MNTPLPILVLTLITLFPMAANAADDERRPAPNCALNGITNPETYDLQRFKGKVLYVDFWASWCGPCLKSFPFMNELDRDLKDKGLQVLGVNLDEKPEDAKAFLEKTPAAFVVAADENAVCAKDFGVKAMPSTFLVDRNGVIRETHYGFREGEAKEFRQKVLELLKEAQ